MYNGLYSMTGYGRGEASAQGVSAVVELRAVNHRFLDLSFRLPRLWLGLEPQLARILKERLGRGRIEVYVQREGQATAVPRLDSDLVRKIQEELRGADSSLSLSTDLSLSEFLRIPGVLQIEEGAPELDAEAPVVEKALGEALSALVAMRRFEGENLGQEFLGYLDALGAQVDEASDQASGLQEALAKRLKMRVEALVTEVEPERLAQEVALLVDKAGIDEEIVRLRSHLAQARSLLAEEAPVGRRLDFLVQELHREANTIGSKAASVGLSSLCVAMKSSIEKLREQAANFE